MTWMGYKGMKWNDEEREKFERARLKGVEECLGKTVARAYMGDDEFAFLFSDGTFILCHAYEDCGDAEIDAYSANLSVGLAHDLGLISDEDFDRKRAESRARLESEERARYEELKKKYGESEGSGE